MKKHNRLIELDGLRGIAAVMVVLFHYTYAYDNWAKTLNQHFFHFTLGLLGVQIFFIISGFVIFMTIEASSSLKSFAISRFTRLYPTYWACIILTLTILTLFPVPTLGNYSFSEIMINLTMLQSFFKVPHIDGAYWTLQIELIFYVFIGILYQTGLLKRIEIISALWLSLVVFSLIFNFKFENYIHFLAILDHAPLFIAGMMFYKLKYHNGNHINHSIIIASLIIYLFSLYQRSGNVILSSNYFIPIILISFIFAFFYILVYFNVNFLRNKYLQFLGYISYPLYLLHEMIGFTIIYRIKSISDNTFLYTVLPLFIVIPMAYMITKYMERPSKLIKNILSKKFVEINLNQGSIK
jgi:peptidoglycan/LPS O-acetylase OafA/YrhL